jgi:hypothetical protein
MEQAFHDYLRSLIRPFRAPTDTGWPQRAQALRRRALDEVYLKGYPRSVVQGLPRVVWGDVLRPHPDYLIRKLRFQTVPGYWVPALLYEPAKLRGKVPVVLNPNGHHAGGKSADYKQARCINLAKRGMIALNLEFLGMSELEADCLHFRYCLLDLVGQSSVGMFYLAMRRALDLLLAHRHADPRRVAMTGLSGGGWQTIVLSTLDPRIKVVVPVAGYTSIRARIGCTEDIGDLEQCPPDLLRVMDYDTMTAMLAPRPTLQILNEFDDCCFATPRAKPVIYDAIRPTFKALGAAERFQWHSNRDPGTHNYGADNRNQLYKFLNRHFRLSTPETDLPYEDELIPEWDLFVGLPADQPTVLQLARRRALELARSHRAPVTTAQKRALRAKLREVIRLPRYEPRARRIAGGRRNPTWLLSHQGLNLPLSATIRAGSERVQLLTVNDDAHNWLDHLKPDERPTRFVAHLIGQAQNPATPGHLMVLESAGQRVLGLRVAQLLAAAKFAIAQTGVKKLDLIAYGRGAGMAALLAAALQPRLFRSVTPTNIGPSLALLGDYEWNYSAIQQSMCPGLLEVADIPQIAALLDGVPMYQPSRGSPVRR